MAKVSYTIYTGLSASRNDFEGLLCKTADESRAENFCTSVLALCWLADACQAKPGKTRRAFKLRNDPTINRSSKVIVGIFSKPRKKFANGPHPPASEMGMCKEI